MTSGWRRRVFRPQTGRYFLLSPQNTCVYATQCNSASVPAPQPRHTPAPTEPEHIMLLTHAADVSVMPLTVTASPLNIELERARLLAPPRSTQASTDKNARLPFAKRLRSMWERSPVIQITAETNLPKFPKKWTEAETWGGEGAVEVMKTSTKHWEPARTGRARGKRRNGKNSAVNRSVLTLETEWR